jgi:hypothetical protein
MHITKLWWLGFSSFPCLSVQQKQLPQSLDCSQLQTEGKEEKQDLVMVLVSGYTLYHFSHFLLDKASCMALPINHGAGDVPISS